MKPIIGLTCNEMFDTQAKQFINEAYIKSVIRAGGCPVVLPIVQDEEAIESQVDMLDGLIVTGGIDVNPLFYGEDPKPLQKASSLERDHYELKLLEFATKKQIPIFGICRGIQVINVFFKGTLYQDLSYTNKDILKHSQEEKRENYSHSIQIEKDSFLYEIFQEKTNVNSFHHQAIKDVAPNFKVVAQSSDGIIEAIQHSSKPIFAVQFHPEAMSHKYPLMQEIFNQFINTIKNR